MFGARPCARACSALVRRFTFELNPAAPHSSAQRLCIATEAVRETRRSPTDDLNSQSSAPPKSGAAMRRRPAAGGAATQTQRTRNVSREFPTFEGHDPDTFGTLSDDHRLGAELLPDDDDDLGEETKLKRMSDKKYEKDIKQLVLDRKIKEALNLFFEIQKAYEVKPTHVMFTLLIGGCGRVGYTKMAFKLYRMMRDRGLEPTPATLTGLFNSCAESPFPEMGLDKAHKLYEQIKLKNWVPSNLTYHAMIKAFGKCGDLDMAFRVMDEMADAKHAITTETFAFLLMACISNKEAGFSLGLKVMRTMLWKKIRPSVYCYNLFLRTVRDCGVGPPEMFQELLESVQSGKTKRIAGKRSDAMADNVLRIEARLHPTEAARLTQTEGDAAKQETTREKRRSCHLVNLKRQRPTRAWPPCQTYSRQASNTRAKLWDLERSPNPTTGSSWLAE
ncbi:hypothetical protein MTO96_003279 [Rhipicephalus appendiculatus]